MDNSHVHEIAKNNMSFLPSLPPIAKLSSRVIRILGCNPGSMTLQGTNTYLIGTGRKRVLVDSGEAETSEAYTKLLNNVLRDENATIEHVLITHWHNDHIGGVESVKNLLKSLHPENKQPIVWKLPRAPYDHDRSQNELSIQWQPLKDDQVLEVEGAKLQIKHTPGHTSDHACFLLQDENILFSGDCVLGGSTTVFEDLHEYILSLKKILKMRPNTIYPGHGSVVDDPLPYIEHYIQHRQQRDMDILQILEQQEDKPMLDVDIVKQIYKETSEELLLVATYVVRLHLIKLQKEGKVFQDEETAWRRIRGKL